MGRIFTAAELADGYIPQPENFDLAARELRDILSEQLNPTDEIDLSLSLGGAMLFGSTVTGHANRRSDLDVLIVHDDTEGRLSDVISNFGRVFAHIRRNWHVPVESTIHRRTELSSGNHTVDPIFRQNLLTTPAAWVIGDNPAIIAVDQRDVPLAFTEYVTAKKSKFQKSLSDNAPWEVDYKALQRAVELPSALGRKVLTMLASFDGLEGWSYDSSRAAVVKMIRVACEDDEQIMGSMNELLSIDQDYNELLDDLLGGRFNPDEYEHFVRSFAFQAVPAALDLTDQLYAFVNRKRKAA